MSPHSLRLKRSLASGAAFAVCLLSVGTTDAANLRMLTSPTEGHSSSVLAVAPSVFDRQGLDHLGSELGIRVDVQGPGNARCTLRAASRRARQRFPSLQLTPRGKGRWEWASASSAPSGNWTFAARCKRVDGEVAVTRVPALVLTENSGSDKGRLVSHSTAAAPIGVPLVHPPPRSKRQDGNRLSAGTRGAPLASTSAGNPYPAGQCTWYAWSRRPDLGGNFGNAGNWTAAASRAGFPVSSIPAAGTIAVFRPYFGNAGGYGHVAYVEGVLSGGRISISEYNWGRPLSFGTRTISSAGLQFIYRRGQSPGHVVAPPPPFISRLDAQFPMDAAGQVYVTAGGPGVSVGFNVRFNHAFSVPDFVLRPNTPTSINRFSSVTGDFPGARAPNDDHVGYFRTGVRAPAGTSPGTYLMQWNAVRKSTGQFGGLQPSLKLVILPPPPPPGNTNCDVPAPGGPFSLTSDPSFMATLDAQFPVDAQGNVYVSRGSSMPFGFNVRFNQPFSPSSFSLRTDTPGTINFFSDHPGDWLGAQAPNDDHVGYFRANLVVPACTKPGRYQVRWNVINLATGKWGKLQPSFFVVVQ